MSNLNLSLQQPDNSAATVAALQERMAQLQRTLASSEQDRRALQERFDNTR